MTHLRATSRRARMPSAFTRPNGATRCSRWCKPARRAGEPFDEEMQIVTLKGRRAWVRSVGHAVRNEAASSHGSRAPCRRSRRTAIAPGTLLRHTVSMGGAMGSGEAFATVDREGRFTYCQRAGRAAAGQAGARTAGPADLELVPEDRARCAWRSSSGAALESNSAARGGGTRRAPVQPHRDARLSLRRGPGRPSARRDGAAQVAGAAEAAGEQHRAAERHRHHHRGRARSIRRGRASCSSTKHSSGAPATARTR